MGQLFAHWKEVNARLQKAGGLFVAFDYDGVLSPIAARPTLAKMSKENRRLLRGLARRRHVHLAVVSGRALADVRDKVRLPGLLYAGNHGAEIQLNGSVEQHIPLQSYREALVGARDALVEAFESFHGVHIEDKGFGIGLHYREVAHSKVALLRRRFQRWAAELPDELKIASAKMMFEVRPKFEWNKGSAVLRLWQQLAPQALPICLGDDKTDEDGFRALKGRGINIFVGKVRRTNAEYYLRSTEEVTAFLKRLRTATRHLPPVTKAAHRARPMVPAARSARTARGS
jgi:trehalose-phosphatase